LQLAALSQYSDIEVEIFEGAEKLAEVGAGIGLFPRTRPLFNVLVVSINTDLGTWEVIKKLGLEKSLLQHTDVRPTDGPGEQHPPLSVSCF
jgi:salicylate hydroxylase